MARLIQGKTFWAALNAASRNGLQDAFTNNRLAIPRGNGLRLNCCLFDGDPRVAGNIADLSNIVSATLVLRQTSETGALLYQATQAVADFHDAGCTFEEWLARASWQFGFALTAAQTNWTPWSGGRVYFVVAVDTVADGPVTLQSGVGDFYEEGIGTGPDTAVEEPTYRSDAENDARYALAAALTAKLNADGSGITSEQRFALIAALNILGFIGDQVDPVRVSRLFDFAEAEYGISLEDRILTVLQSNMEIRLGMDQQFFGSGSTAANLRAFIEAMPFAGITEESEDANGDRLAFLTSLLSPLSEAQKAAVAEAAGFLLKDFSNADSPLVARVTVLAGLQAALEASEIVAENELVIVTDDEENPRVGIGRAGGLIHVPSGGNDGSILDFATNAAKLGAVETFQPRQRVRITGEGNRIEEYLGDVFGGGQTSDRNWLVIRNTVQLSARAENNGLQINGVSVPVGGFSVADVGWVDPLFIPIEFASQIFFYSASIQQILDPAAPTKISEGNLGFGPFTSLSSVGGSGETFVQAANFFDPGDVPYISLPFPCPPRCRVAIVFDIP